MQEVESDGRSLGDSFLGQAWHDGYKALEDGVSSALSQDVGRSLVFHEDGSRRCHGVRDAPLRGSPGSSNQARYPKFAMQRFLSIIKILIYKANGERITIIFTFIGIDGSNDGHNKPENDNDKN